MFTRAGKRLGGLAARIAPGMLGNRPNFLGIGAAKSGTTAVAGHLAGHPEISFPRREKELHFFDYAENVTPRGIRRYFAEFRKNKAMGEYTPSYMFVRECRDRIFEVLGRDVRFIVGLRNPADRAFSHYCHAVRNWGEEKWQSLGYPREDLSFEDAIEAEPERLASGRYHVRHQSYFSKGLYAEQLKWYFGKFAKESFYIYILEDFAANPLMVLRDICAFLGVDNGHSFKDVTKKVNSQTDRNMDPGTRRMLLDRYEPSIADLEGMLERDLSRWRD